MKFENFLSPAKLNLGLKITGKRSDGYHTLNTIFCLIDLFDNIDIQVTHNGKISLLEHNQVWFYKSDLSYKAACLFQQRTQSKMGANIKIHKLIPSGSGMGGGSSNAATVLIALNMLWGTNLSQTELMSIGSEIGADVAFFIFGQNSYATSIGDKFDPVEIPLQYFVLIKPDFHINTKQVFQNLSLSHLGITQMIPDQFTFTTEHLLSSRENDLESTACTMFPDLELIKNDIKKFGIPRMTGSGSTLYLKFNEFTVAKNVAQYLRKDYNTYLVKSLSRSPIC